MEGGGDEIKMLRSKNGGSLKGCSEKFRGCNQGMDCKERRRTR